MTHYESASVAVGRKKAHFDDPERTVSHTQVNLHYEFGPRNSSWQAVGQAQADWQDPNQQMILESLAFDPVGRTTETPLNFEANQHESNSGRFSAPRTQHRPDDWPRRVVVPFKRADVRRGLRVAPHDRDDGDPDDDTRGGPHELGHLERPERHARERRERAPRGRPDAHPQEHAVRDGVHGVHRRPASGGLLQKKECLRLSTWVCWLGYKGWRDRIGKDYAVRDGV